MISVDTQAAPQVCGDTSGSPRFGARPDGGSGILPQSYRRRVEYDLHSAGEECRMADGTRIRVVANLASRAEVPEALAAGAEGCGLLCSETLFLGRSTAPSEDEQLAEYQAIARALGGRPLTIRTLDACGDRDLSYVRLPEGENPALGLRGVRLGLLRPDLLRVQLRAILRVEPVGQCSIVLPKIATLNDLRAVRAMLTEEKAALGIRGEIPLGIMVEVPSAAMLADRFAVEADFLLVGTSDLTQYALAMDRSNPRLANQLDAFHPAVLRLIDVAARGARSQGRWIGVSGGLAAFPQAAPVLIGLGVSQLSAEASAIPRLKALIGSLSYLDCTWAAQQALEQDSVAAVRQMVGERWSQV